jgi:hypothetical protein
MELGKWYKNKESYATTKMFPFAKWQGGVYGVFRFYETSAEKSSTEYAEIRYIKSDDYTLDEFDKIPIVKLHSIITDIFENKQRFDIAVMINRHKYQ